MHATPTAPLLLINDTDGVSENGSALSQSGPALA
jgi:hypothetical protein